MSGQITKNFHIREMKCKDGTEVPVKYLPNAIKVLFNLQELRDDLNKNRPKKAPPNLPITLSINSGYRTPSYNKKVGGKPKSQHLLAKAADITCKWETPKQIAARIERLIKAEVMTEGGIGVYIGFTHWDCRRTKARW